MVNRKLLDKLSGRAVTVFADHHAVVRGSLEYHERGEKGRAEGYYVRGIHVPIRAMRNVCTWNEGNSVGLIFVDQKYGLGETA